MIGLDTNVLIRYVAQDDVVQSPIADATINSLSADNPGWVGIATVLEFVWVMISTKRVGRTAVAATLDKLLMLDTIVVEQPEVVASAVRQFRTGKADFADCLIAASARAAGCSRTVTFDRVAARDASMELLA
ncbi:MAG TPA: type II toxin-antitoxin system VapC family toxin [Terracidiphilus sp.]|nr:type II toxin-antitoxin system VapC family toxin [Terracidiphilus sp.]